MLPTFSYRSRACCVEIISQYRCLVGWGGSPKNGPLSLLYISDKNWQKTFQVVLYKRDKWRRLCGGHNLHQINNESWKQLKKVRIRNFISLFCVLLFCSLQITSVVVFIPRLRKGLLVCSVFACIKSWASNLVVIYRSDYFIFAAQAFPEKAIPGTPEMTSQSDLAQVWGDSFR